MKLVVCHKCRTMVPADTPPMEFNRCKCGASSIAYTGEDNEVAVSGPCTIVGCTDADWQGLLVPQDRRNMVQLISIMRTATTVIDLDSDQARELDERCTHIRTADGEAFALIATHPDVKPPHVTIEQLSNHKQLTIAADTFRLAFKER